MTQAVPESDVINYFDGTGLVAGRLGTVIAKKLLNGERVEVVNAEHIIITGTKDSVFADFAEKRGWGKTRKGPYYPRSPHRIYKRMVRGMLPYKYPRGRAAHKLLRCHIGVPVELKSQTFSQPDAAKPRDPARVVTLGQVSTKLGFNVKEV